jgi:acid phosphatase
MFSGSTQGVSNDNCLDNKTPFTTPNLGALLLTGGFTFKGYAQTLPQIGSLVCTSLKSPITGADLYARKHAPWVNWQGDQPNDFPDSLSRPMTDFPKDFTKLPTVAFVIPDMDNDMHNIGAPGDAAAIQRGDQWLKNNLSAYVEWAKTHNSLLILTFDEDDFTQENHIPTIIVGGPVKPGKYNVHINHYNVLHTVEAMYGISPQDSTGAAVINGVWK